MKPICLDSNEIVQAVVAAQMPKGIVVWYPNEDCTMRELNQVLKTDFQLEDNKIILIPCTDESVIKKIADRLTEAKVQFEIHGG
jgi:hypothetical protein